MKISEFKEDDRVKAIIAIPGRPPVEMAGVLAQIGDELILGHAVVRGVDGQQGPEVLALELLPHELTWEEFCRLPVGARFTDKDGKEWEVVEEGCRKVDTYSMTIINPYWVFSKYQPLASTGRVW